MGEERRSAASKGRTAENWLDQKWPWGRRVFFNLRVTEVLRFIFRLLPASATLFTARTFPNVLPQSPRTVSCPVTEPAVFMG